MRCATEWRCRLPYFVYLGVVRLPRWSRSRPHRPTALALFKWSNVYLGLVLLAICLASLGPLGR